VKKLIVVVVLLMVAFSAGFIPQYAKGKRLEIELREARRENSLGQLRDLAGLAYLQASQKDYGLAGATSTSFFNRAREVASETPDANGRKPLEDLLSLRDQITADLARGDPGVESKLQTLLVKTRQATAAPARRPE
jgi:hypothetical protein